MPGETYTDGQRIRVYVMDVFAGDKGPRMKISRTRAGLVERLFEMEVPEIYDGTIEIKATAREAGSRTKMAVWSKDPNVDAVGACIGPKGSRVAGIVDELGGEKIDVVKYSEDIQEFHRRSAGPRPPCSGWRSRTRRPAAARSPCRTTSCRWPSATRVRTPVWLPSSPGEDRYPAGERILRGRVSPCLNTQRRA